MAQSGHKTVLNSDPAHFSEPFNTCQFWFHHPCTLKCSLTFYTSCNDRTGDPSLPGQPRGPDFETTASRSLQESKIFRPIQGCATSFGHAGQMVCESWVYGCKRTWATAYHLAVDTAPGSDSHDCSGCNHQVVQERLAHSRPDVLLNHYVHILEDSAEMAQLH